jgi:hypothetical protein
LSILIVVGINSPRYIIGTPEEVNRKVGEELFDQIRNNLTSQGTIEEKEDFNSSTIIPDDVYHFETEEHFNGNNIFVMQRQNNTNPNDRDNVLIITDDNENTLYERNLDSHFNLAGYTVEFINTTTVLLGMGDHVEIFNIAENKSTSLSFEGHHDYEYNPISKTIFTLNSYTKTNWLGLGYVYDRISEYNLMGQLLWTLKSDTFIPFNHWDGDEWKGLKADITHSNTIFFDPEEEMLYYNTRNTNTFYKINHTSREVIWGLGENGDFQLIDKYGMTRSNLFYHPHAVEKINENTFILFDNDYRNKTNPANQRSRLVEIQIDEDAMIAHEVWSWQAPVEYYSAYWGDADRLPNGNRLGTFGTLGHPHGNFGARLVEVNSRGEIVWEHSYKNSPAYSYGIYRMERFLQTPTISKPSDVIDIENSSITIDWDNWFNYRTKWKINGSYTIFLNDTVVFSASHEFEKFWQSSPISYTFSNLPLGDYNVSILLLNDDGQYTTDSINISIVPYFIQRSGPVSLERGEINSMIEWSGKTNDEIKIELTINGSLLQTVQWNGENFSLDLKTLDLGLHIIMLQQNISIGEIKHIETIKVRIYPPQIPIFRSTPQDFTIIWNEEREIVWEIFDASTQVFEVFVNSSLTHRVIEMELGGITPLNWSLPQLDEGIYEITIVVYDRIGLSSLNSVWVTIISPSPPIVSSIPARLLFDSSDKDAKLSWIVHGGKYWKIYKDGLLIDNRIKTGLIIEFDLINWSPGVYNITLQIIDSPQQHTMSSVYVTILLGDKYGNTIIESESYWFRDGNYALGKPDGKFAEIFLDYGNGKITVDMGKGEEIINQGGSDFMVYASDNSIYRVWAGNDLNTEFIDFGIGTGDSLFDLNPKLTIARYIMIEYSEGILVEVDAIEAFHFNIPDQTQSVTSQNSTLTTISTNTRSTSTKSKESRFPFGTFVIASVLIFTLSRTNQLKKSHRNSS